MAAKNIKPFPELPYDSIYVLDLMGGVSTNLAEPDNPLIDCYFTPLIPTLRSENTSFQRDTSKQIRIPLAVGYLPSLYLGQAFEAQKRAPAENWPPAETLTIEINTTTLLSHQNQATLSLRWPISAYRFSAAAKKIQFTAGVAQQIETDVERNKWKNNSDVQIAIPDMEITRLI